MIEKIIPKGNGHIFECEICSEMAKRGYISESKYWEDLFDDKLKPIKYKLIKQK